VNICILRNCKVTIVLLAYYAFNKVKSDLQSCAFPYQVSYTKIPCKRDVLSNSLMRELHRGKRIFQFEVSSLRGLFTILDFAVIKRESCFPSFHLHIFIMHSMTHINWTLATVRTPVGRMRAHFANNNNAFSGFQKIHLPATTPFPISWVTAYVFSAKYVGFLEKWEDPY